MGRAGPRGSPVSERQRQARRSSPAPGPPGRCWRDFSGFPFRSPRAQRASRGRTGSGEAWGGASAGAVDVPASGASTRLPARPGRSTDLAPGSPSGPTAWPSPPPPARAQPQPQPPGRRAVVAGPLPARSGGWTAVSHRRRSRPSCLGSSRRPGRQAGPQRRLREQSAGPEALVLGPRDGTREEFGGFRGSAFKTLFKALIGLGGEREKHQLFRWAMRSLLLLGLR